MGLHDLRVAILASLIVCAFVEADDSCPGLPACFCSKDKTSVNCEGKNFTEFPTNVPTSGVKLYFGYNAITRLSTDQLAYLPYLEKLLLNVNKLTAIEAFSFRNLTRLNYLDLRGNKLTFVGKDSFSDLPTLQTLYLTTNLIETIEEGSFNGCKSLESIYLQSNKLKAVPPLGDLPALKQLVLEGNLIENATFPETFFKCTSMSNIVISNNNIEELRNETFQALQNRSLSTLYLSRNKITTASAGVFSHIRSITSLKLGSNPLDGADLRALIGSLAGKKLASIDLSDIKLNGILMLDTFSLLSNTTITSLKLTYNKIQSLENNVFYGLNRLIELDLSNCQLQITNEASFNGLDSLNLLNLEKNKLTDIPRNLPSRLTKLYMDDNQITAIPDSIFGNLEYLQELYIRYNSIQTLTQGSFMGLLKLERLNLYHNVIATIPGKTFDPLTSLKGLDMAKNNLANIQQSVGRFSSQGSLQYINLADNNCVYLQPDFFKFMTSLTEVHLERNNLGGLIAENYGGSFFASLTSLNQLYLMENSITHIPGPTFQSLESLQVLNVSRNKLRDWDSTLFRTTPKLRIFDVSYNLVANLQDENLRELSASLRSMNLTGNPFMCDCDLRWFRDWIDHTSVQLTNNLTYTCNGPAAWKNQPLMSFSRQKINCFVFTWWMITAICVTLALVIIIVSGLLYRKRWPIKLFIYKLRRTRRLRANDGQGNYGAINPDDGVYDAYISCSEDDTDWVRTHLLPVIDNGCLIKDEPFGGEFKCYFGERDSQPGSVAVGQMYEGINASRKVIVVLSRNYLNPTNLFELDLTITALYEKKLEDYVVIHIDKGLPLQKFPKHLANKIRRNEILEWTEDAHAQALMKGKLTDILKNREVAADRDTV
ncbi:insulin-like growth factor-binding protein complex acid labile subunit isoform X2 [Dreissena polymorpha]|uniref:TIR domain-containing protein n=2 Tax=Dreissena polymorpha TaxID=45954 RepID=A0A9D4IZJ6_DREPO|nr:insulin-like growth factor-binding protein complex acid labile subunit isoform X2 [Dreissena polymorpha]KAH3792755.1 hypothetical protein DPMN_146254 [Dreissena polymorpha]